MTVPLITGDALRQARESGLPDDAIDMFNTAAAAYNKQLADDALTAKLDQEMAALDAGRPTRLNSGVAPANIADVLKAVGAQNAALDSARLADVADWDRKRGAAVAIIGAAIVAATGGGAVAAIPVLTGLVTLLQDGNA